MPPVMRNQCKLKQSTLRFVANLNSLVKVNDMSWPGQGGGGSGQYNKIRRAHDKAT